MNGPRTGTGFYDACYFVGKFVTGAPIEARFQWSVFVTSFN
jgi:hypothetical protein